MFVVAPSGEVSYVDILENAPKDSMFVVDIKNIYYDLKFSKFKKQIPDTILFNSVFYPQQ